MSKKRQASLKKEEKEQLELRLVSEIVEFLSPKQIKEGEDIGRQSGSLQWRMERGEIHLSSSIGHCFHIKSDNLKTNKFEAEYNTVRDSFYFSDENDEKKELKGWKNSAYSFSNIQYKIEHDWKMCYLARTQGSDNAFIEWLFNIDGKKVLEKIEIKFSTKCYENGQIDLNLILNQDDNQKINLSENQSSLSSSCLQQNNDTFICLYKDQVFHLNSKKNSKIDSIKIRADLSNGKGDCSWQHTQLFRTSLNNTNEEDLFKIIFHFKL